MRPSLDCWQGRDRERQKIWDWMAEETTRLIGIRGIGGMGKSTLAAKIYEEDSEKFENKFWADASRLGFTDLARRVLLRLGLAQSTVEAIPEQSLVDVLVNHLREGEYLLVIDNLESLLQEDGQWLDTFYQQFFQGWLGCGSKSVVLVTTREHPDLPEVKCQWLYLPGLKPVEGAALLKDLGILGTQAELEEFVKKVEGHPLLLMLVAGFLRAEEEADPQIEYLQRCGLADVPDLLSDEKLKGLHRGKVDIWMLRVLETSFSRINHLCQKLLLNACVYRLPFNAVAVSQPQITLTTIEQDLRHLASRSLLQEERDNNGVRWFQFQPFILEYAKQKAGDLTEAHQRAINYYLLKVRERPWQTKDDVAEYLEIFYHWCELKQYAPAFDILRVCNEFLELRGYSTILVELYGQLVQDWNLSRSEWQFRVSLIDLGNAYQSLGQYQQAIEYHQQALEISREIGDRYVEGSCLGNLGNTYSLLGENQQAIEYLQQHLEISREIGNRDGEGSCLGNLGNTYSLLGENQQAIEYLQQSLEISREIGNRSLEGKSLGNLGSAYQSLGQYQQAIEYLQQSLELLREIGDRHGEGGSLGNLGNVYNSLGQYQQAIEYHQQSLEISGKIGDRYGEGNSLGNLGNVYQSLGQYQQAIEYHQQALEISREIGNRDGEGSCFGNLGNTYSLLGENQQAIEYLQQHLEISREIGNRDGEGTCLANLGRTYSSLGQYRQAIEYLQQSLEISREIGDRSLEGKTLGSLGNAYYSLGQYRQAIEYFQQSLEISREIGDRHGEGNSLGNLGNVYQSLGQYRQAIEYHQQSLEILREIGDRRGQEKFLGNLGNVYQSLGQYEQAIEYHQQSLEILRKIGDRRRQGNSLRNLGKAYYSLGQYQQAIEYFQQSLEILREIGDRHREAIAWFAFGDGLAKLGHKSKAITAYKNARELYQSMELDVNVQNCNNAIKHLSRKSRPWLSLPKPTVSFLLRSVYRLWRVVAVLFRRGR